MDRKAFSAASESLGLTPTEDQLNLLEGFEKDLYETNEVMNLTRIPQAEAWLRHFIDSILFHDLIPQEAVLLDIGTGPGFPSYPLAVIRPDLEVIALDSSGKMLDFLRGHPLLNLTVIQTRMEDSHLCEEFDVITGRAVAPLPIQLELSAQACKVGGVVIPMRSATEEIPKKLGRSLGLTHTQTVRRILPTTEIERGFPIFEKKTKTPRGYPRRWAEIRAEPITD